MRKGTRYAHLLCLCQVSRRPRADEGEEGLEDPIKENGVEDPQTDEQMSKSAKRRQKKASKKIASEANGTLAEGEKPARQPRKPKGPPEGEPSKTLLFVANLPFLFSDEQLKAAFDGFNVKSAKVVKRRFGPRTKGFGFVELESEAEQQRALQEIQGKAVEGRELSLKGGQAKVGLDTRWVED